jgi:hypothetical protein
VENFLCHQCEKIISRRHRRTAQSLHTEHTEYTETLLRMLFCESLRRLRETIPLRMALV